MPAADQLSRPVQSASIRRKLMAILMATSFAALVVACAAFIIYDYKLVRESMRADIESLARVMGGMNTETLTFDDPKTAQDTIAALRARQNVVLARVYNEKSEVFAEYLRQGATSQAPKQPTEEGSWFGPDRLFVYYSITDQIEKKKLIGGILIESDLEPLRARQAGYINIALVVMAVSLGVALLLSAGLQKLISQPILNLAEATRRVSQERNYSLRVQSESRDEIGQLIAGFNDMLAQIQSRDAELLKARDQLEIRVQERTAELEQEVRERAKAEAAARAVATQLERSNRELQDFAYVASHDLQEPLRKVQAFGDRLRDKYAPQLGAEAADFISRMQNAAGRMQVLINDLLSFSRVTTKANPFEQVNLEKIAREVLSDLEIRIQHTNAKIEVDALPKIEADPLQMRQLLQNLVGNALKFHPDDARPVVKIGAKILQPGDTDVNGNKIARETLELCVKDNGIGFDEKYLDKIFAVFQRLHGRGVYEGTGIGLAICRKIAERHGGAITARSKPGEGATFFVMLPIRQAQPI